MDFSKGTNTLERSDDLLTEILLRLPSKSVFKFTCVSTRWNNVIMDRSFRNRYCERTRRSLTCSYPRGRLLGFVQCNNMHGGCIPCPLNAIHHFFPVRGEEYVRGARCGAELFPIEKGYFITSSKDGLILCGHIPDIYYVGNPITGRWETLPPPPPPEGSPNNCLSVGLSSNEEDDAFGCKIIKFRVIVATGCKYTYSDERIPGSKIIPIETYSSRTREWRRSRLISKIPVKIRHAIPPSFSGGFFHWLTTDGEKVVAYDPSLLDKEDDYNRHYNRGSLPNNQQQHVVQLTETPDDVGSMIVWRSDNAQTMLFARSGLRDGVAVYRKRDDSDDWACISEVGLGTMKKDIIGITQKDIENEVARSGDEMDDMNPYREMVWLIAFIPWDPTLIMLRFWDRIYVYDCIKMKLDHEVIFDGDCQFSRQGWEWYPYFHTLSNAAYNLKHSLLC